MLKTSSTQLAELLPLSADVVANVEIGSSGGGNKMVKRLPPYIKSTIGTTNYLLPNAKVAFTQLRKPFIKALIFCHFDPEYYIQIEIDMSGYAINRVLI